MRVLLNVDDSAVVMLDKTELALFGAVPALAGHDYQLAVAQAIELAKASMRQLIDQVADAGAGAVVVAASPAAPRDG